MKRLAHTDSDLGAATYATPLFDSKPAPVHAAATRTERKAAERVAPKLRGLRAYVIASIEAAGSNGLTPKECVAAWEASTGKRDAYSIAPRFPELARADLIERTGLVRDGADCWRLKESPHA